MSEESDTSNEYRILAQVDIGALLLKLQVAIQRAIEMVSFGLVATEIAPNQGMALPAAIIQLMLAPGLNQGFDTLKHSFGNWIIANAIRDCNEALNAYLDRTQEICAVWSLKAGIKITGEEWKRRMEKDTEKFRGLPFPEKFKVLKKEYEFTIPSDLKDDVLSIYRMRNCLVHGGGIISNRYCNSTDGAGKLAKA